MPQRSMELEVSFRLFGAIKRMQFTFSVDQPICMPNALSAAECWSGGGDDGSHGQGSPGPTREEGELATLRRSPSPLREEPIQVDVGAHLPPLLRLFPLCILESSRIKSWTKLAVWHQV
jgi:hypothetical protein